MNYPEIENGNTTSGSMLAAALKYLHDGWRPFPLQPRGKKPLISWSEYQDRAPTVAEVTQWWTNTPDANIGIVTGAASGIVVIDIDSVDAYRALLDYLGGDTDALCTLTSLTANGQHLVYRHPEEKVRTRAGVLPGVDVRGDGGYIVAPPSVHPSGTSYRWSTDMLGHPMLLGAKLRELLLHAPKSGSTKNVAHAPIEPPVTPESGDPHGVESWVIREGSRNDRIMRRVASLLGRGVSVEDTLFAALGMNAAQCNPPLPEAEVRRTVESIARLEATRREPLSQRASHEPDEEGCVRLGSIAPETVDWLWDGYVPLGKLTVIDGDPGLGKSSLTLYLAALVSTGGQLPDGTRAPLGNVLLLSDEDGIADTMVPRLSAMGANRDRIFARRDVKGARGERRPLSLPEDAVELRADIVRHGAKLVIIDPLVSYLSKNISANNDQEMRRVLGSLRTVAEDTGAAIIVVRHLNKKGELPALYRGGGSIGIVGAARIAFVVAKDPSDDEVRVLAGQKSNLGRLPISLRFRLEDTEFNAPRIVWMGVSDLSANDLFAPTERTPEKLDAAMEFIVHQLAGGEQLSRDVRARAKSAGIRERTFDRAVGALQHELKVGRRRDGGRHGHFVMFLIGSGDTSEGGGGKV